MSLDGNPSSDLPAEPAPEASAATRRGKSTAREYSEAIVFAVILFLFIRVFLFQAYRIPTGSMEDTLVVGDFLIVNKFLYGAQVPLIEARLPALRDPRRGEVVVFSFPRDTDRDFIKRVIGVPGDRLRVEAGEVYINGEPLDEPYVKFTASRRMPAAHRQPNIFPDGEGNKDFFPEILVPEGKYFMMGDNRDQSDDSRFWGFVDRGHIKGRAELIHLSFDERRSPRFSRFGQPIR